MNDIGIALVYPIIVPSTVHTAPTIVQTKAIPISFMFYLLKFLASNGGNEFPSLSTSYTSGVFGI